MHYNRNNKWISSHITMSQSNDDNPKPVHNSEMNADTYSLNFKIFLKVKDDINTAYEKSRSFYKECTMENIKETMKFYNPIGRMVAWIHSRSTNPLIILELCRSKDPIIREIGIKTLAEMNDEWGDWQYSTIRQALDFRAMITLAKYSEYTDLRLFPQPPMLPKVVSSKDENVNLANLLGVFPPPNSDKCLGVFNNYSLFQGNSADFLYHDSAAFDSELVKEDIDSIIDMNAKRLSALLIHTSSYPLTSGLQNCQKFVSNKGLQILQQLIIKDGAMPPTESKIHDLSRPEPLGPTPEDSIQKIDILCRLADIISNVCQFPQFAPQISQSGWLGILVRWSRSDNLSLSLRAFRALTNLDFPNSGLVYPAGVYLCHPLYNPQFSSQIIMDSFQKPLKKPSLITHLENVFHHKTATPGKGLRNLNSGEDLKQAEDPGKGKLSSFVADAYFVHGLMGDPFKTWRKADRPQAVIETEKLKTARQPLPNVTQICWPKDWLSKDIPSLRIMLLSYETYLSEWAPKFPLEQDKRSIQDRSVDLLNKIVISRKSYYGDGGIDSKDFFEDSKIIRRPIIFVTHSLGGLLIKQMLIKAHESNNSEWKNILKDTLGVVFYSTPHRGSPIAKYTSQAHPIFYPSLEVKQLRLNNPDLLTLNEKFLELIKAYGISCLSFGETRNINVNSYIKMMIVPLTSSNLGSGQFYELPSNHLYVCKPHTKSSPQYSILIDFFQDTLTRHQERMLALREDLEPGSLMPKIISNLFVREETIKKFLRYNHKCNKINKDYRLLFPLF
ncbi:unnamed protein product [Gordionus sp. m RMFG-2023]